MKGLLSIVMAGVSAYMGFEGIGILSSAKSAMHQIYGAVMVVGAVNALGFAFVIVAVGGKGLAESVKGGEL